MPFWRRLLRVPWTARRSNQSILKEINPEYSLEGLMLKLKLQYFVYLIWRANSLEKTLMLGKIEGKRRSGWQRMRWLDSVIDSVDMNLSKLQEIVKYRGAWRATVHGVAKSWTQLSGWTTATEIGGIFKWMKYHSILGGTHWRFWRLLMIFPPSCSSSLPPSFFSDGKFLI